MPRWSLLIAPRELGITTKVGATDDSVDWDVPELEWVTELFKILRKGPLDEPVWSFTYGSLIAEFRRSCRRLGVNVVPYQLRHSGASWDRLQRHRSLEQIMKRGRWGCMRSVARYEKSARVAADYAKLTAVQKNVFEKALKDLKAHVLEGRTLVVPAGLASCSTSSLA